MTIPEPCEIIFHALAEANFDVFLDRFSIEPGENFQTRLRQELADKAMVLLLESQNTIRSQWTRLEIAYASKNRLGLFALSVPHAVPMPGIRKHMRMPVTSASSLPPAELGSVVHQIRVRHQRALVKRGAYLRQSFAKALLWAGVSPVQRLSDGLMRVNIKGPNHKHYALLLVPRPAELPDFFAVDQNRQAQEASAVVGPVDALEPGRRAALQWVASQSRIGFWDEGHLLKLAQQIGQGAPI